MKLKHLYTAAILTTGFALSACAQHNSQDASDNKMNASTTLTAYHWNLDQAVDADGNSESQWLRPESVEAPTRLTFSENRLAVTGLCNNMNAGYHLKGSNIEISPAASTMMLCPDEALMQYEQNIGRRLAEAASWEVSQTEETPALTLSFDNGSQWILKGDPTAETKYGSVGQTMFLEVAAETKPCTHPLIDDFQCLQVRTVQYDAQGIKQGHGEWQHFYDQIDNYEHTPGVRNVLRVKRYENTNVPADASSYAYVLDMVVESEQQH